MKYELKPLKSQNQKSFYGKAYVEDLGEGVTVLYSYGIKIMAKVDDDYYPIYDGWSATTGRHIKAFSGMNKAAYMKALSKSSRKRNK